MDKRLGVELHCVDLLYKRAIDASPSIKQSNDLTGTHGWVLGYLSRQTQDVYQKDIERVLGIRRSSATELLQLMEKNGLIVREAVEQDKRLKRIVLTERGSRMQHDCIVALEQIQHQALTGLSDEQVQAFYDTLDVIRNNLRALGDNKPTKSN